MMNSRSRHDQYGKRLFGDILRERWVTKLDTRRSIDLGGVRAAPDGIILTEDLSEVECVVEIESTVYTQARSALLNLAFHPAPKKLFVVILPKPEVETKEKATRHYQFVWGKLSPICRNPFKLVVLGGTGAHPMAEADRGLIKAALLELRVLSKGSC